MSEIIDLADARRPRQRSPEPRTHFATGEEALAAMRSALDTLTDACLAAGDYWPTSPDEWAGIAKAGLRTRLQRRAIR